MQKYYNMNSATARAKNKLVARTHLSERGTSAVMEAMKELYNSVDFGSLSAASLNELKNLVTKEGKEKLIGNIFTETMHISTFLNWNFFLLARPASYGVSSMTEAMSLNFQQAGMDEIMRLRAERPGDSGVENSIEDYIDKIKMASDLVMSNISTNRFVLHEHPNEYEICFTLGSKPHILSGLNNFCNRSSYFKNTELMALGLKNRNSRLFLEMEEEAGKVLANIDKILGTSYTTKKARGVVPLGYDFGILFSNSNAASGEFNITARSLSDKVQKRYSKAWELGVEVQYRGDNSLTTNIAKLSALDVIVLPTLRISRDLMSYLTQCSDPTKIKLSTVHGWTVNWLDDAKGTRNLKGDTHKRVFFTSAKSIAVSNSLLDNFDVSNKKAALGIKSPDTRADDTGICVNFEGKFVFAPNNSVVEAATIEAYEEAYTKMLLACAANNEPFVFSSTEDTGYLKNNPATASIVELHNTISSFRTCALISNWDLNICGSVETENPARLTTVSIAGATKANVVGKADLLRSPIQESMHGLLGKTDVAPNTLHTLDSCHFMASIYAYLRTNNKIKDLDDYLSSSNRAVAPNKNRLQPGDYEYGIYARLSNEFSLMMSKDCMQIGVSNSSANNFSVTAVNRILGSLTYLGVRLPDYDPKYKDFVSEFNRFVIFFRIWSSILSISSGSWLDSWERNIASTNQVPYQGVDSSEYFIDPYSAVHLFTPMAEKYVVGNAFSEICKDMLAYINSPKNIVLTHDASAPKPHMGTVPQLPTFVKICESLGPFLSTFGHTIPNAEAILAESDLESKKFVLDENTVVDPIPGMKGEFHVFKHQHRALQLLANEPRAAILDISPGGGKTIIGLVDCLQLMGKGRVKLPLFIAPNKLIKNWMQDLNREVTDFKFNCVPITGYTLRKWGEEKLSKMIRNAPPNTIFHTDTKFIKDHTKKSTMNLLSNTAEIYSNLEWMKQFDWDYILFDESHTMKNAKGADGGSVQSRLFGELTLRESVKFIRLASGTIIHKDMDDIIGQTRLFDPLIFRTQKEFEKKYSLENEPKNWSPDAPKRIREHMGRFCAVSRAKSKDWAYALPEQKRKSSVEWLVEFEPKFKEVYEHIIAKTIEAMGEDQELADLLKATKNGANGDLDDDALDNMGEEDVDDGLAGKYSVYLSRLEQFLICPENDPLNGWNGLDFSKLKTPKMDRIIKLLDQHLAIPNSGKVIIFVRHISSIDGILSRLPARLASKTVKYSSTDRDGLVEFETEPKIRVIIGMEQSMNTGINLQLADRIIRVEIPWAAGDVEQGFARAFRPDFHNKYNRPFIYDDWIIVNDSLEIPKLCRLISGTIRKVQFDEYGSENKDYMTLNYLKSMSLNLKRFMNPDLAIRRYDQVEEYFTEYDTLAKIQKAELQQERDRYIDPVTGKMGIINPYVTINRGNELTDSKFLPFTPMLGHQSFAKDPANDMLSPFHLWLAEHKKYQKNTSLIADDKVLAFCEFGYGYIVEIGRTRLDCVPPKVVIRTNNGDLIDAPTDSLYIVGRKPILSDDSIKKYIGRNNKTTRLDKYMCPDPRDVDGLIYVDNAGEFCEYNKGQPDKKLSASSLKPVVTPAATTIAVPTTKINPALPVVAPTTVPRVATRLNPRGAAMTETDISVKPTNSINRIREKLAAKLAQKQAQESYVPEDTGDDGEIVGSMCVVSDSLYLTFNAKDPDTEILKTLRFNRVKPFVGIEVKGLVEFNSALSFIENRFKLVNPEGIYELRNRFHKKTKMFAGEYQETDNKFLMLNYKPIKDEKSLKLYYIVEDGNLYLVFNAEAHPKATVALMAKKPKGVADRFKKYSSTLMRSVLTKRGAISIINQVNEKAKIKNYDDLVEAVAKLTLV